MVKLRAFQIVFVLLHGTFQSVTPAQFSIDTAKNRIVDSSGRERLFHGENVVMKTTPFVPITDHFDARLGYWIFICNLLTWIIQN